METRTIYLIYVRPLGSHIWTQHAKSPGIPWRSGNPFEANYEAVRIVDEENRCAVVKSVTVKKEMDSPNSKRYAILADEDTRYTDFS